MNRAARLSPDDRGTHRGLRESRSRLAALPAILVLSWCVTTAFAQQLPDSVESAPPQASEEEPQTLHAPASLEGAQPDASAGEAPSGSAEESIAEPAATRSTRDLLSERLAAGDGNEDGDVAFQHEGISYVFVTTPSHASRQHAKNDLDRMTLEVARKRYAEAMHSPRVEFWFPLDLAFVRSELLPKDGERIVSGADGRPGYVGHAILAFDQAFDGRLRAVRVASRSMQIVVAGGAALALLAVAFAFLRLDRATRGLYTGRLQTWAIVAGAVVVFVSGAAAYWIPWI